MANINNANSVDTVLGSASIADEISISLSVEYAGSVAQQQHLGADETQNLGEGVPGPMVTPVKMG